VLTAEDVVSVIGSFVGRTPDPTVVATLEHHIHAELEKSAFVIPPFPSSVTRVLELIAKPDLDLNELVRVLHWEPSVVAEIVRVANSVAYKRGSFDDLRGALLALGMAEVGAIAAAVSARSLYEVGSRAEFELFPERWLDVHRDALVVAFTASWLAHARNLPRYDRVFLRSIIAGTAPMLALRALAVPLLDGRCAKPAAEEISAAVDAARDHAYAMAIERWQLPASVASVIDPASQLERTTVALVSSFVELRRHPYRTATALAVRDHACALGLDASWLKVLLRESDQATARVSEILTPAAATPAKQASRPAR
jgi:HD-like signal output (HDOD) protein